MNISIEYFLNGTRFRTGSDGDKNVAVRILEQGDRTLVTLCAQNDITLENACISLPYRYELSDRLYLNGYQSWTDTREFGMLEPLHNMNLLDRRIVERFHFDMYGDAWFHPYTLSSPHSFTFSYIRKRSGNALFFGSMNEENAFLIIEYAKRERLIRLCSDCEGKKLQRGQEFVLFDYLTLDGCPMDVLRMYFDGFGKCSARPIRGYTSWYQDYQNISSDKLVRTLSSIDSDEFDLFQIDDGYESFVGDWEDVDSLKFPDGLEPIVSRIHQKGLMAGIWLAPFVCETKSRLYREHNDWIYRSDGKEIFAGCNWSGDPVLDLNREDVWSYIERCLLRYKGIGFDFFKLDFLYAAAITHKGKACTRAEAMRSAMKRLRDILGNSLILGCGVPLSSAFSLVDYCRIGPDVSLYFDDIPHMRLMHRERISTKVTLQNTIYRSCMDGTVFRCDPDVFLLRNTRIWLLPAQRKALTVLNHLCGSVFMTSDDPGAYDDKQKSILASARALSRAKIMNIDRRGYRIRIVYELNNKREEIIYDWKLGILIRGDLAGGGKKGDHSYNG